MLICKYYFVIGLLCVKRFLFSVCRQFELKAVCMSRGALRSEMALCDAIFVDWGLQRAFHMNKFEINLNDNEMCNDQSIPSRWAGKTRSSWFSHIQVRRGVCVCVFVCELANRSSYNKIHSHEDRNDSSTVWRIRSNDKILTHEHWACVVTWDRARCVIIAQQIRDFYLFLNVRWDDEAIFLFRWWNWQVRP